MARPVIALLTDFGSSDHYAGAMKGVGRGGDCALLTDGQFAEAENVYRAELAKHPRNGRALFGLAEALKKQNKNDSPAMVLREFEKSWEKADTKLVVEDLYKVGK